MKISKICLPFVFGLIIWGCEKPAPTELIQSGLSTSDSASIEVVTKNLNDQSAGNGYDSTGVIENVTNYSDVIVVSGVKITSNLHTFKLSIAQATFFDKTKPIYDSTGNLFTYRGKFVGGVFFNGYRARIIPYRVSISLLPIDTSLGSQYILYNRTSFRSDPFVFPYDSTINFKLNALNGSVYTIDIPTPPEVTGNVKINGSRDNGNLRAVLDWDANPATKMEIIIGGVIGDKTKIIPIYKIKTKDDGEFVVPSNLLNSIPTDRFDKLAISFIRRYRITGSNNGNSVLVLSQSVHTIIVEDL